MRFPVIFFMLGRLLLFTSSFMLLPILVAWIYHEDSMIQNFLYPALGAASLGVLSSIRFSKYKDHGITVKEGFLLVTLTWLLISFVGCLPFHLSGLFASFMDSFFEAISGFTTTGASILTEIESLPKSILFWRSFSHWIGGMGIIVLAVAILPQLSVGGMQLMKNETPGPSVEQLKPRIRQTAMTLWQVYLCYSILQVFLLWAFGMDFFDSICHMFGTMGTGGFSTKNASIAAYGDSIQIIITIFMFLAGMNFVLHYYVLKGDFKPLLNDSEWKFYVLMLGVALLIVVTNLTWHDSYSFGDALRLGAFQIAALTSTTGYATADFDAWPYLSQGMLFLLMFVGGCAGSTSGGFKQLRLMLLFKRARQSVLQHIYPKAVVSIKVNKRPVPEHVMHGISSLYLIYLVIFSLATLFLLAFDLDFVTATSAVVASLSNIGPGFEQVGATQNYAFLPDAVKGLLCFLMLAGRLEIFTVLVLFFPHTWKR